MSESRHFGLENPWVFVFTNVVVWVVVVSTIQTVLFNGELTGAVIEGTAGGWLLDLRCSTSRRTTGSNTVSPPSVFSTPLLSDSEERNGAEPRFSQSRLIAQLST